MLLERSSIAEKVTRMRTFTVESADRPRFNVRPKLMVRAILVLVIGLGTAADIWGALRLQHQQADIRKHVDVIAARLITPPLAPETVRD